ncbi:uncharacterized protein LOC129593276 [Paramacrobiotus metropolitanus]|uniref:uncharacterized protein LOC129593276 n=1 Tax=Paramacrobiotus metropolitanus TaxID=2943436 RepID=UPI002445B041|nr:uncharacterized protein LOC129593276 [Paramacrobiotus metropolitanus]
METMGLCCAWMFVLGIYGTVQGFPFDVLQWSRRSDGTEEGRQQCEVGQAVESLDPCQPYCVCVGQKIVCAQIACAAPDPTEDVENVSECWKLKNPQRCCPDYVCRFSNGSATIIYPTPTVNTPDNLYALV